MPLRSVDEINITDFVDTGLTTPMDRYTFTLEVKWTDTDNVQHIHGPQVYTFPNDLASMPLFIRRAFAEKMIIATVRVTLGIDDWEMYR